MIRATDRATSLLVQLSLARTHFSLAKPELSLLLATMYYNLEISGVVGIVP